MRLILHFFTFFLLSATNAPAQNLQLDPSFDHDGFLINDFGQGPDNVAGIALLPGGKFLVGSTSWNGRSGFAVSRYHADGSPDLSFGSRGRVFIHFSGNDQLIHMSVLQDGKILLAGSADHDASDDASGVLVRLLPDGTLDQTFGSNGRVLILKGYMNGNLARAATVLPDGKILIAVHFLHIGPSGALLRYSAEGLPDTTFGSGGLIFGQWEETEAAALQPAPGGKILLAGTFIEQGNADMILRQFNENGEPDYNFGDSGIARINLYEPDDDYPYQSSDYAKALLVQPDSMIVVVGHSYHDYSVQHLVAARLSPVGELLKVMPAVPGGLGTPGPPLPVLEEGLAVALQADGKIVAAGTSHSQNTDMAWEPSFFLVRFDTSGSTDVSFDENGLKIIDIADYDRAQAVTILPDGNILAAGQAYDRFSPNDDYDLESDIAMVRLDSAGQLDAAFGNAGIALAPVGTNTDRGADVAILQDGKILLGAVVDTLFPQITPVKPVGAAEAGSFYNTQNIPNFTLARYLENGDLDTGFGKGGRTGFTANDLYEHHYFYDYSFFYQMPYAPLKTAFAFRPNGNILIAGIREMDFGVAEFYPDGTQDSVLIGTSGAPIPQPPYVSRIDFGSEADVATAIVADSFFQLTPSNLVMGYTVAGYSADKTAVAWCCGPGIGGVFMRRASVDIGPYYDYATAVGYQVDTAWNYQPNTLVGGYYLESLPFNTRAFLYRLTSRDNAGFSLDTAFGDAGIIRYTIGNSSDRINAFTINPDNSIIAAGAVDDQMAVFRFLPDGSFDNSFGNGGVVVNAAGLSAQDLAVQPDGRIVATGYSADKIVTLRLLPNGQPDPAFGINGVLVTNLRGKKDRGMAVAIQPDGKIVVAGASDDPYAGTDITILRYKPNSGIPPLSASAAVGAVSCAGGSDGQATVTASGGIPPYHFLWNTGDTSATISGLTAGMYTVTVTHGEFGQIVLAVGVTEPTALDAGFTIQSEAQCNNQPGTASVVPEGGAPPYSWEWSSGETGAVATLPAGDFTLTLTDYNGCTEVFAGFMPVAPDTAAPTLSCPANQTTQACATPVQYDLPVAADNCGAEDPNLVSGLPPGSVFPEGATVVVYQTADAAGNTAVCQFEIQVDNTLVLTTDADPACPGELNLLTASAAGGTPPYAYIWSSGNNGPLVLTAISGLFTVTLTDALGCARSDTVSVQSFPPMDIAGTITPAWIDSSNGAITVTVGGGVPPFTYAWYQAGQQVGTGPMLGNVPGGDYTLIVTDAAGCMNMTLWTVPEVVATAEPANVLQCRVFPNPFTEKLTLQLELQRSAEVRWRICDLTGRCYDEHIVGYTGYLQTELKTGDLPAGMYLLYIRMGGDVVQRKVVKVEIE